MLMLGELKPEGNVLNTLATYNIECGSTYDLEMRLLDRGRLSA